jgi:hypothetical protein
MTINRKDAGSAAIFLAIAIYFGVGSLTQPLGTITRMGPGLFPLALAIILGVLGLAILLRGFRRADEPLRFPPLRSLLVLLPPLVFALTVRGLGLGPAIALVALVAALANPGMKPATLAALTATVTIFCVVVFSWGLDLSLPVLGPWMRW